MQKKIISVIWLISILGILSACQRGPRVSPAAWASCDLGGGKTIKTSYSRPRMNSRKIYGELVPFGKVWRAGANEATTFVTSNDLLVQGTTVPAGAYTIFTVPAPEKWTLIINKYEKDELARVDMKVSALPNPIENFTIAYERIGNGCTLHMDWETTRASVDFIPK